MKRVLGAAGFTATIAQIVLLREILATFYGNELLFGLVFASWLLWTAAGARFVGPRLAGGSRGGLASMAALLALAGLVFPLQIALARGARLLLGTTPGAQVEFGTMIAAVALLVAPLCCLLGALFTLAAQCGATGGTVGRAYAWESLGGVIGGALFSFVLLYRLDPFQTAFVVAALDAGIALSLLYLRPASMPDASIRQLGGRPVANALIPIAAGILLAALALPVGLALQQATLRWQWPALVFSADSPYARLIVEARAGQRIFYSDSQLAFETQGTSAEEVAHFPLLLHPDPKRVLLIGGGVAGDLREILKHPVSQVVYVEPDPTLVQTAEAYLPSRDAGVLRDRRVTVGSGDGRAFVRTVAEEAKDSKLDVVVLDLPPPDTAAVNRFYTAEFFSQISAILAPGGLLALNLPSAENYWSPELARRNASIYATLRSIFPYVVILPGERNFFLASGRPLEADPGLLAKRLEERKLSNRWVTKDYIHYVLTTDRLAQVREAVTSAPGVRLNRDRAPICYFYDLVVWISRFRPDLARVLDTLTPAATWWLWLPVLGFTVLARARRRTGNQRWAVLGAIAVLGLAGMVVETVVLLAFQVLHGSVYEQVSLVVTAFMGGLAAGAWWGNYLAVAASKDARRPATSRGRLIAVLAATAVLTAALPALFESPVPPPAPVFWLLALAAGSLVGMGFPLSADLMAGSPDPVAGSLYGADLAGGAAGALLGSVFFVPLLGIPLTCLAVAAAILCGLAALV